MTDAIKLDHTPMIKQYLQLKSQYPDYLLLYQMGDFYELFFADAIKAAKLLNITLTKRGKNLGQEIHMAGVPCHTVDTYIHKLIQYGETVVICEQVGEVNNKGPMERKITRIISPGTVTEEELLPPRQANFIVGILPQNPYFGLASLDISTGIFKIISITNITELLNELSRVQPVEIIIPEDPKHNIDYYQKLFSHNIIKQLATNYFAPNITKTILDQHFGKNFYHDFITTHHLQGKLEYLLCLQAAAGLLHYVKSMHNNNLLHINNLNLEHLTDLVIIDSQTRKNLEIINTLHTAKIMHNTPATVLGMIDHTKTPMGSRLLFDWLNSPSKNYELLEQRYQAIEQLQHADLCEELNQILSKISDLARIISRIAILTAKPKDLLQLKQVLELLPELNVLLNTKILKIQSCKLLNYINNNLNTLPELITLINSAIIADPPIGLKEGNFIASGYDQELDRLRTIYNDTDLFLQQIELNEKQTTKISTLKIGFNKIHGYYLEVSRNQSKLVPNYYTRRQTLKNVERFISPELKQLEDRILSSKTLAQAREKFLFEELLKTMQKHILSIQQTAHAIAVLDVINNLAELANLANWSKPELSTELGIEIIAGRHPVIEAVQTATFIPNNLTLNAHTKMLLITGPNMGGKSTYMRQTAVIVLLALIGSFVPAHKAIIGPIDRIFSRIGASDDLTQGRSTFMLEMLETAHILQHATAKSLVIIDEIGRGTSTFDGMALAYAIAKHLVTNNKSFCLFATHYLELTNLAKEHTEIANAHLTALEKHGELKFLYKIEPGPAAKSFGLQVAKLAGIPEEVIKIAKEQLLKLENQETIEHTKV